MCRLITVRTEIPENGTFCGFRDLSMSHFPPSLKQHQPFLCTALPYALCFTISYITFLWEPEQSTSRRKNKAKPVLGKQSLGGYKVVWSWHSSRTMLFGQLTVQQETTFGSLWPQLLLLRKTTWEKTGTHFPQISLLPQQGAEGSRDGRPTSAPSVNRGGMCDLHFWLLSLFFFLQN